MNELKLFIEKLNESFIDKTFVKITLSKPTSKSDGLMNVYIRLIIVKNQPMFSFTYHYQTNDQVKNFTFDEVRNELLELINKKFKTARLFSLGYDYAIQFSKKGKATAINFPPSFDKKPPESHDIPKKKRAELGKYLTLLGVADEKGIVIPKMADKFKQINKYLEIIESLLKNTLLSSPIHIVDMGSGKGYLTFALYDFLVNQKKMDVRIKGIEQRKELVDFCNATASTCGFNNIVFEQNTIQKFNDSKIDILIALHACDTATDDAIFKGFSANAKLIICAPCCHKQLRQDAKGKPNENPLFKHGIFKERQYEMITDTIRALIMEKHNYQTKIFEFISNEHTRKNVMLVGIKTNEKIGKKDVQTNIDSLKEACGVDRHYLEIITDKIK